MTNTTTKILTTKNFYFNSTISTNGGIHFNNGNGSKTHSINLEITTHLASTNIAKRDTSAFQNIGNTGLHFQNVTESNVTESSSTAAELIALEILGVSFAIIVNSFCLWLIVWLPALRFYKATPFVVSLLMCDVITAGGVMVPLLLRDAGEDIAPCPREFFVYFCLATTVFSALAVTCDRAVCIITPYRYNRLLSPTVVTVFIVSVWMGGATLAIIEVTSDSCHAPFRPHTAVFILIFILPPLLMLLLDLKIITSLQRQPEMGAHPSFSESLTFNRRMTQWQKYQQIEENPRPAKWRRNRKPVGINRDKHVRIVSTPEEYTQYLDWAVAVLGCSVDTGASVLCQADIDKVKEVLTMHGVDLTDLNDQQSKRKSILKQSSRDTWDTRDLFGSEFSQPSTVPGASNTWTSVPSAPTTSMSTREQGCCQKRRPWCPVTVTAALVLLSPLLLLCACRLPLCTAVWGVHLTGPQAALWLACVTVCTDPLVYVVGNEIYLEIIRKYFAGVYQRKKPNDDAAGQNNINDQPHHPYPRLSSSLELLRQKRESRGGSSQDSTGRTMSPSGSRPAGRRTVWDIMSQIRKTTRKQTNGLEGDPNKIRKTTGKQSNGFGVDIEDRRSSTTTTKNRMADLLIQTYHQQAEIKRKEKLIKVYLIQIQRQRNENKANQQTFVGDSLYMQWREARERQESQRARKKTNRSKQSKM